MAEETQATEGTTDQTAAAAQSGERTFTQEEVNRMVADRIQRERRKYEGYVDGKDDEEAQKEGEAPAAEGEAAQEGGVKNRKRTRKKTADTDAEADAEAPKAE